MKVAFLSVHDWANLGYNFAKAMKSIGVNAEAFTVYRHVFNYPEQATLLSGYPTVDHAIRGSDVIVFMHSQAIELKDQGHARLWVFHGGTAYRKYPQQCNQFFNPIVDGTLVQDAVMLGQGAKNEHWVLPPVDSDLIQPYRSGLDTTINVGHFPSCKYDIKGTDMIVQAMYAVTAKYPQVRFLHSTEQENWLSHLERIKNCDVYIDQVQPDIPMYGAWGVSALEAASAGCIVMASFKGKGLYESQFGPCPIRVVRDADDIKRHMEEIVAMSPDERRMERESFRNWVMAYHSYEYVGKRLLNIFNDARKVNCG